MAHEINTRIRQAVADYMRSEGCSCCQNIEQHKEAERILAGLLDVPIYSDGSGYDFNRFATDKVVGIAEAALAKACVTLFPLEEKQT